MNGYVRLAGFALLLLSCRRSPPSPPAPPPSAAASAPSTVPPSGGDLLEVGGLRVRAGTLPSRDPAKPGLWGFTELGLDPTKLSLEIVRTERGAQLAELLPDGALAVVNGGYFEADFRPSTWLKQGGVEVAKKSDTSKGGVLALGAGGLYLGPFSGLSFDPVLAVQSFPLIVEPGGRPGIHRDDGRRAARTVACAVGERLHFVVLTAPRGEGPTLFESAAILVEPAPRGFGCRVALNLDGGPSSGVWFAPQVAAKQRPPLAKVGYAIAIVPRPMREP